MKYIVYKRFNIQAICGEVDLPVFTECESKEGVIYYNEMPLCLVNSENAHLYFVRNDDGNGLERSRLIRSIIDKLSTNDEEYQERWDKVWSCPICRGYKRPEHSDHWVWGHAFYIANIDNLRHIANLIGLGGN